MTIKVSAKYVLDIDLNSEVKFFDTNNKLTALNIISDTGGYTFNINGKTLTITNGINTITVANASKLKYYKTLNDSEFKDIISDGLFNNIAPIEINRTKLNIKGATNYNDTIDLHTVSDLTKIVNKQPVLKTCDDKGFSVDGGKGNDTIIGSMYSDTIKGGTGNDFIDGNFGNDTINSGDGNDFITGGTGNDKLTGGKGEDTFIFLSGDGVDTITDADYSDTIQITGTNKEEIRFGKNGNSLEIYYDDSFDENNKIVVQNYFTKIKTGKQPMINAMGEEVEVINYSLTGTKSITGTKLDDNIVGSSSKDTIKAVGGINTVNGRGGNDSLYAGTATASKTTFIFTPGDGQDIVYSGKGEDTLVFENIDINDLSFEQGSKKNPKDLIIRYSEEDFTTVKNYFTVDTNGLITGINPKNTIKHFIANNQEYNDGFIIGTSEKDRIYVYNDSTVSKIYADNGNDIIDTDVDNLTIHCGKGNDRVSVHASGTSVYGGDGNDKIGGSGIGNVIYGGKGNDVFNIYNNYYIDTVVESQTVFVFNKGDGNDRLSSWKTNSALNFADSSFKDLKLERLGDSLVIKYNSGKDSVTLQEYYGYDYGYENINGLYTLIDKNGQEKSLDDFILEYNGVPLSAVKKYEGTNDADNIRLERVENLTVYGNNGNDKISVTATGTTVFGGNGNDEIGISGINNTIYGGKGNDKLYNWNSWSNNGAELQSKAVFIFKKGDGNDTLSFNSSESDLNFSDSKLSDLTFERLKTSLVIKYNSGKDSVTLEQYFVNPYISDYEPTFTLIDKTGTRKSLQELLEGKIISPVSTTEIIGTDYDDSINIYTDNLTVYGKKGDDMISVQASGTTVYGGDGSDDIYIYNGTNNTIHGGKGNDAFSLYFWNDGEPLENTLVFNKEDGQDILPFKANNSTLILKFNDVSITDMSVEYKGSVLVLKYNSGKDSLSFLSEDYDDYIIRDKEDTEITLNNLIESSFEIEDKNIVNADYILSQVAAFTSSNNSDLALSYDNQNTNDIPLYMPEYNKDLTTLT